MLARSLVRSTLAAAAAAHAVARISPFQIFNDEIRIVGSLDLKLEG